MQNFLQTLLVVAGFREDSHENQGIFPYQKSDKSITLGRLSGVLLIATHQFWQYFMTVSNIRLENCI